MPSHCTCSNPNCRKNFTREPSKVPPKLPYCSRACWLQCTLVSPEQRFWRHTDRRGPDDCWPWKRPTNISIGYGRINLGPGKGEELAHRFSWILHNGPIPKGLCVLHKCDNPACVNPAHLFIGTRMDNVQDMTQKGRGAIGARHHAARLSDEDIMNIRKLAAQGISRKQISEQYGISPSHLCCIVHGTRWKHLPIMT